MTIKTDAARRELAKETLFRYLPAGKQEQALAQLAAGADWDTVAERVNQWVEEGDWERHATESAARERDSTADAATP
ncbi:MAG: hypothetical protein CL484_14255 [Acidobacteria bacterium]|jgi:hypothetical protein|nr:hypothetical protein [Acidobacteriota bacterium]|tara:strand:+ start:6841 stop:7071 length:231 start_codon:yes stop_codon:yes gene_type:complete